jgi:hypothetical protein
VKWERIRRDNHWFDALYNASVAGHGSGVRLVDEKPAEPPKEKHDPTQWIDPARFFAWLKDRPRW